MSDIDHADHAPTNPIALEIDFAKKSLTESLLHATQSLFARLKNGYVNTADTLVDEVLVMATEQQLNDALQSYVTDNVEMILNLRMALHDDWLRLFCTVDYQGIFASVACNFRLVEAKMTAETQHFVFEQLSDVDIISLHSKKWWQGVGALWGLKLYRWWFKADPLPVLLHKIKAKGEPFATYEGKMIYLDIHRYIAKQTKFLGYLKKVQANHATTKEGKLLVNLEPNFTEIFSFGDSGEDIITEKDNPNRKKSA